MFYSNVWQVMDSWTLIDFGLSFSFNARIELVLGFFLIVSFVSFLNLVFRTNTVLEVLFWSELLLITSIGGMVAVSSFFGTTETLASGVLLLTATAVEAAIGMMLVLETSNLGVSQKFENLTRLRG